jgi:SAM-dependent methyltransferase
VTSSSRSRDVTPDGSPVEVYRRLPPLGEPEVIAAAVPPGSELLELGCGAGRLTHPLIELGYRVTAVDESAAMLAHVRGAVTVQADIRGLDLGRRFDAVLLASHFVNAPDDDERSELLRVCARHVTAEGCALVECYPPELDWTAAVGRERAHGPVVIRVAAAERAGARVAATVEYEVDGMRWRQPFEAEMLDEPALRSSLERAGLQFDRWLDRERGWFAARLARA